MPGSSITILVTSPPVITAVALAPLPEVISTVGVLKKVSLVSTTILSITLPVKNDLALLGRPSINTKGGFT